MVTPVARSVTETATTGRLSSAVKSATVLARSEPDKVITVVDRELCVGTMSMPNVRRMSAEDDGDGVCEGVPVFEGVFEGVTVFEGVLEGVTDGVGVGEGLTVRVGVELRLAVEVVDTVLETVGVSVGEADGGVTHTLPTLS